MPAPYKAASAPATTTAAAPPLPSEAAKVRLQGMRGKRGRIGDSLHALGVRLGEAYGGSFYYPSEDRSILECIIFPYYQLSEAHRDIVFVGNDWYTHGYARMFGRKNYATIDPDPAKVRYGAPRNILDTANNLGRYFSPQSLDVIFFNGIIGWGLNDRAGSEATFTSLHACLRPGGHLIVGWNDLPDHKPFALDDLTAMQRFKRITFPPLGVNEYMIDNEWRHTYSFFSA